ncbi:hypothetical protein F441_06477 [Phytophthora nicotianae CJ01A1]|uniref:Uncharacterized protein n=5 Tax=Phytophthora nicotianae TaxID=4792 RepID=W2RBU4_PHYN3|nr:hypothetical protein PPTG_20949 [Phytophthora nicotianae INRA-310]ETI49623.1 hypothetical protein F443_06473 [Phytophthora nicotianae P1569]ETO78549.1 hypothetical protein F444_06533 [Phytophthora nicotianae P1976]ETP19546.1 hypothetical protein F441_06477 [Phytophthora nicotianae CJ01A1]ETP47482.1 hypothetical protein F442_06516 [Phytophthora nicotianae P10297]ETN22726.1 hypothetical protein PPTG_20949 [Phytophthora nicotianae INRA-310]
MPAAVRQRNHGSPLPSHKRRRPFWNPFDLQLLISID